MKKLPFNYYVLAFYLLACTLGFLVLIYCPQIVTSLFSLHYGFLALALFFILKPSGKAALEPNSLAYSTKTLSFKQWLASIIAYQAMLGFLFLGFAEVVTSNIIHTVSNAQFTFKSTLFTDFTLSKLLLSWGLFPWGIYLVVLYLMNIKKQRLPTSTFKPLSPVLQGGYYTINLLIRQSLFWGCALFISVSLACLITTLAQQLSTPISNQLQVATLFILISSLAVTSSKRWNKVIRQLWDARIPFGWIIACHYFYLQRHFARLYLFHLLFLLLALIQHFSQQHSLLYPFLFQRRLA